MFTKVTDDAFVREEHAFPAGFQSVKSSSNNPTRRTQTSGSELTFSTGENLKGVRTAPAGTLLHLLVL